MLEELDPLIAGGLTEEEAARRLATEGYNELPSTKPRSIFAIAMDVVREPMFLLLVACGLIYLTLGDLKEALILMGFVFVVMGITLYQERKTERALEALRDLSSPRALVVRNSVLRRIPGREVVRGDVIVLSEGDRVPADGACLTCTNLSVDESLLTGESVPVRKIQCAAIPTEAGCPGGDDLPFVYSSTLVVKGQGVVSVTATAMNTEIGKIGRALQTTKPERTRLQRETSRLVRNVAVFGSCLCAAVVLIYGFTRGDWLHGILAGITLAMALLPEEFPVVMTIFLALGAWRISRKNVLTRRVPAVETLGAATVLCVDKTGTLTLNCMRVSRLYAGGQFCDVDHNGPGELPDDFHELVEFGILAGQREPFDPMEKALRELGENGLIDTAHLHDHWTLVREYPLSEKLLSLSHVWKSSANEAYVIAAKGAPEAIADLCHFDEATTEALVEKVHQMADRGLRVLGAAKASFVHSDLPGEQHDFPFRFLGLIGFSDPVRPGVPAAIAECHEAGIRVVMITGDYPGTALSIASQIGISNVGGCITGPELDAMDDGELQRRIGTVNLFARVVPEQKLRLVNALKANGEVVAMTGDGVNDAPALKSAHIGVAMGGRGTDVARESAALVLLDDDFSSIVGAVRVGRRIFDNLKRVMAYIFAIHVPIAGMSLLPILFKWPLVFYPVHIAFLELIIDPACSVAFEAEPEEEDVMKRPPRDPGEPLFGMEILGLGLLQGLSVLVIVLGVYVITLHDGRGAQEARALTFTALVMANLGLILANRSWTHVILATLKRPNPAVWWVIGGALGLLALVLYVPFLRELFQFSTLHADDLLLCLGAGVVSITWFELLKVFRNRKKSAQAPGR